MKEFVKKEVLALKDSSIRWNDKDYNDYNFGFSVAHTPVAKTFGAISEKIVIEMSKFKNEPSWVLEFRLKSLEIFNQMPMPNFGPDLSEIDFEKITYYSKPSEKKFNSWEDVPAEIRETFEKIGVPEHERKFFGGVEAQFDSEIVYSKAKAHLEKLGIIFISIDEAIRLYPEIVKRYFAKIVPPTDNKFASLNSIFFSGGSFVYIPKDVVVDMPLQAYFRINSESFGQFERTLIIAEENSSVQYLEGCTAPIYKKDSLHAAVVEVFVGKNASVQYTTIQNWSKNVYNLVTKRSIVEEKGKMEWVDGNLGSKITMKYPSCILKGKNSHGEIISIGLAGKDQIQDTGTKMIHIGEGSTSRVVAKSICKDGGITNYRGKIEIKSITKNAKSSISCDALILDEKSSTSTFPRNIQFGENSVIEHEARVSKVSVEKLFYLQSRGILEEKSFSMVVQGFLDPMIKNLPIDYAVEMKRLIDMEMIGSVG
ncbi:MAG: Fe-S cluster assembly protein SufB [Patescibacteria group bacterium]